MSDIKRVAILGAGVSGLTAIKACLEEGVEPVCFEQRREIGGMWSCVDESLVGCAPHPYKTLVTNSSKGMTCFSDFPFPKHVPTYMTTKMIRDYLNSYAEHFKLNQYINLETRIHKVSKARDYDKSGKWEIEIEDNNGGRRTDVFHGVIVCTGVCVKPKYPTIEGVERFQGKIEHSMSFSSGESYKDKIVVVVGNSYSAGDISVAVCEHADQIYLSVGSGCLVLRRFDQNGRPTDMKLLKRIYTFRWMVSLYRDVMSKISSITLDHNMVGILPKSSNRRETYILNDEISLKIMSGKIKVVDRMVKMEEKAVVLEGGNRIENVDVVLFATGYDHEFPFLDKNIIDPPETTDGGRKVNWYKMVFPVHLAHNTLAMVGLVSSDGSHIPLYELQSRLAARVIAGNHSLPAREVMLADVDKWNAFQKAKYSFYKYQVPYVIFRDEIAAEIGVKPTFWQLFWKSPKLAILCTFGTAFPVQFRLLGPHNNDRAAKLCYDAHADSFSGIQHRKVGMQTNKGLIPTFMNLSMLAVTASVFLYYCS